MVGRDVVPDEASLTAARAWRPVGEEDLGLAVTIEIDDAKR
jgi:hypothetical protein